MFTLNKNLIISELTQKWHDCGISEGDTVLLHSDVKKLLLHYNYFNQPKDKKQNLAPTLNIDLLIQNIFFISKNCKRVYRVFSSQIIFSFSCVFSQNTHL